MKTFPFIQIEKREYPAVIMGEDAFTGWFSKGKFDTEEERAKAYKESLKVAYGLGVRGFSISPHETLMQVLNEFKKENPDIVCIANPHWQMHYYIGEESLWSKKNLERLGASEAYYLDQSLVKTCDWFKDADTKNRFSKEEIACFRLDEGEYRQQLKRFRKFCDFCLVGNLGRSALILLGREDIVKKEIELARKEGFVPLGMCEGGALALPKIEQLDVGGSWVWINKNFACPNLQFALKVIKNAKKPITAYRIFASPEEFNFEESIKFIKSINQIKSIVVGVEHSKQAKETFSRLQGVF